MWELKLMVVAMVVKVLAMKQGKGTWGSFIGV